MDQVVIRHTTDNDVEIIAKIYWRSLYNNERYEFIKRVVAKYPSFVALSNNEIVGFTYTNVFAPDILELDNIFIHENYRNKGIGTKLMFETERETAKTYNHLVLVNSKLYESDVIGKRPATEFYINNGYQIIINTGPTKVFYKNLQEKRL